MNHVFLGLLRDGSRHGYELKRLYDSRFPGARPLAFGQVYATLQRLERDNLVEVLETRQDGGPERTVYALTTLGEEALRNWLATPEQPTMYGGAELVRKTLTAIHLGENALSYLSRQRGVHLKRMRELVRGAGAEAGAGTEPSGSPPTAGDGNAAGHGNGGTGTGTGTETGGETDTDTDVVSLSADYAIAHLDADLRWLEAAADRVTRTGEGKS